MQEAVATAIGIASQNDFFAKQREEYTERRDTLLRYFDKLGLPYTAPDGSYFVLLDISRVKMPQDYPFPPSVLGRGRDYKAAWFIAIEIGVSSIPVSEFYCEEHMHIGEKFSRFAFCKDVDTLARAGERLLALKNYLD